MLSHRSLALRLVLTGLGTLLFCVVIYLTIGWAVWTCQPRLVSLLGKRKFDRWWLAYANAAGSLFPEDADGDGVCDGLEFFFQTDPHNPASHPSLQVANRPGNLAVSETNGSTPAVPCDQRLFARSGERQRLQCWLLIGGEPHPIPAGFRVRLTPSPRIALALPDGPPTADALLVPVGRDGTISFDALMQPEHFANPRLEEVIGFSNPVTNQNFASMRIKQIWADPPLPLVVTPPPNHAPGQLRLSWSPVPDAAEAVVLEAARDDDREEWFPLIIYTGTVEACGMVQRSEGLIPGHTDKLKLRVVPVCFSPPERR